MISEIIQQSSYIKLVPGGLFTKYYFNNHINYNTSDNYDINYMIYACDILGYSVTNENDISKIYDELMRKYNDFHHLI